MSVLALLAAVVIAVLFFSQRQGKLVAGALVSIGALAALWIADVIAISQDWRDTDGFVDCNDVCTAEQEVAGIILIGVPILVFLLIGILVFAVWRPGRRESDL